MADFARLLECELNAAKDRIKGLEADKLRLDFLESNAVQIDWSLPLSYHETGATRAAIDLVMKHETK
jgi:hypothetical protein